MAYEQLRREKKQTPSAAEPVKTAVSAAGRMTGAPEAEGMGAQLDAAMMARMRRFEEHQIPAAEQEADRIAQSVSGARTQEEVKEQLGEVMGADFSNVRFHTGANAVERAEGMGARAFAAGQDVYFGEGGFDPAVAAHELVHTAQQGVVDSGMQTVSAPAGGVQMMPKWADIKRGFGNIGHAIAGGAKKAWGKVKSWFGGGRRAAESAAPAAEPRGAGMMNLGGEYSSGEMTEKVHTLLPEMRAEVGKASENFDVADGNRFFFMRGGSSGDNRSEYMKMMKRAGRETNIDFLEDMASNGSLENLPEAFSYKDMKDDSAERAAYQDKAVAATDVYLSHMQNNPAALDALRQSAAGLYGQLGAYSEDNKAGLAGGKLEAAHRAMNDMLLRSFGPDILMGKSHKNLGQQKERGLSVIAQAMASMQPAALTATVNQGLGRENKLTPQEAQMAEQYRKFFERNGML